ncbi:hypothetical protein DFH27DRAFT_599835 [Peziza echinospora]|nr:hypothetical protein DFH27DRAFT_599835 [Peziza echinospora]
MSAHYQRPFTIEIQVLIHIPGVRPEDVLENVVERAKAAGVEICGPKTIHVQGMNVIGRADDSEWLVTRDVFCEVRATDFLHCAERVENPYLPYYDWKKKYIGITFTSPQFHDFSASILALASPPIWWSEFESLCAVLLDTSWCRVILNRTTGVVVNVSLEHLNRPFTTIQNELDHRLVDCKKLACCIYLWEGVLQLVVPPYTQSSPTQRSIRRNPFTSRKAQQEVYHDFMSARSLDELYAMVNCDTLVPGRKNRVAESGSPHYSVSFSNIRNYNKYSVAFRLHEGCLDAIELNYWRALCCRIVDRAILDSPTIIRDLLAITDYYHQDYPLGQGWTFGKWDEWMTQISRTFREWLAGIQLLIFMRTGYLPGTQGSRAYNPDGKRIDPATAGANDLIEFRINLDSEPLRLPKGGLEMWYRSERAIFRSIADYLTERQLMFKEDHDTALAQSFYWAVGEDVPAEPPYTEEELRSTANPYGVVHDPKTSAEVRPFQGRLRSILRLEKEYRFQELPKTP